jgi:hypothetical protein
MTHSTTTSIVLGYGRSDAELIEDVRTTVARWNGNLELAALDYCDANPSASVATIVAALREILEEAPEEEV